MYSLQAALCHRAFVLMVHEQAVPGSVNWFGGSYARILSLAGEGLFFRAPPVGFLARALFETVKPNHKCVLIERGVDYAGSTLSANGLVLRGQSRTEPL